MRDIEDYFEPIDVYEGMEIYEEDIIRFAEQEDLLIYDKGKDIYLTDHDDNIVYEFKFLKETDLGKLYLCTRG